MTRPLLKRSSARAPHTKRTQPQSVSPKLPAQKTEPLNYAIPVTLVGLVVLAYCNSLHGPFLFDDIGSIPENPTIRQLRTALFPPPGETVSGRPLLNLSFALNYALSGLAVTGYHILNIALHALTAVILFGLVRRTLLVPALGGKYSRRQARWLAACIAGLWSIHPLCTEAVTYTVQRSESMASLFIALALYCLARANEPSSTRRKSWLGAGVAASACAILTKETGAVVPLLVIAYDWFFQPGSFREQFRQHRWVYLAFASTWILLLFSIGARGATAGTTLTVTPLEYAVTQLAVIAHYLRLCFWPAPLVLDYNWPVAFRSAYSPGTVVTIALLLLTCIGVARRVQLAFAGFVFFAVLAPSSSLIPVVTEVAAERRMYLPLAAVIAALLLLAYEAVQRLFQRQPDVRTWLRPAAISFAGVLTFACITVTFRRNADYKDAVHIWQKTVSQRPQNPRAHYNLALELEHAGRFDEALPQYLDAARLQPDYIEARINAAALLQRADKVDEALTQLEQAVAIQPGNAAAHMNYGQLLSRAGRKDEALSELELATKLAPQMADAHYNYANALAAASHLDDAVIEYDAAIKLRPDFAAAYSNWGNLESQRGDTAKAQELFQKSLAIQPASATAHFNFGALLARQDRLQDAEREFVAALRIRPDFAPAQQALEHLHATSPAAR